MNTIQNYQNYEMTNYQMGFQARGGKKIVKTLADLKSMTPLERKKYNADKIWDKLMKMDIKCECDNNNLLNEMFEPHELGIRW